MGLFNNDTHLGIWLETHCHRCFQPDEAARRLHGAQSQCPIFAKAMKSQRKPVEWERNPRAQSLADTMKCHSYLDRPPILKADKQFEDVPMFDVDEGDKNYVPVDGWPEAPRQKGTDHA